MLKDTVNNNVTMSNSEELAKAVSTLCKIETDFYDLMGIVALMSDAILRQNEDESSNEISGETRRGFLAISKLVEDRCNDSASNTAEVKFMLERILRNSKIAA